MSKIHEHVSTKYLVLAFLIVAWLHISKQYINRDCKDSHKPVNVIQAQPNINTTISESVRQNIHLIENDLVVSESSLLDELQINGYISEEDAKTLKDRNRTDQAHIFAQMLEVMDDESFFDVVRILKECSFEHIASALKLSYSVFKYEAAYIPSEEKHSICPICRLKREVDIKEMRSDLKKEDLLSYKLYRDINEFCVPKGSQDGLWKSLLDNLKSCGQSDVETRFIKMLNTPKHRGLFECFQQNYPTRFECCCHHARIKNIIPGGVRRLFEFAKGSLRHIFGNLIM